MRLNAKLFSFLPLIVLALVLGFSGEAFTADCTCGQTQSCDTGLLGVCAVGTQTCHDGEWGPCEGPAPSAEICGDGLDNDCDGKTDCDDCSCTCDEGCTLTLGYWKNHNRFRENLSQQLPWPIDEETMLCEETWLEILQTAARKGNAFYILGHQWIAAVLNEASGASVPSEVDDALTDAEDLLNGCEISDDDREEAIDLAETLDDYNNGRIGPGHCDDVEE